MSQSERRVRSLECHLSEGTRPDSVFIQELEEEMLHSFHKDVLMSLQPLAHGHESSISVKGFNGVCLESTYSGTALLSALRAAFKLFSQKRRPQTSWRAS